MKNATAHLCRMLPVICGLAAATRAAAPPPPIITWPPARSVLGSNQPDLQWAGYHDACEIHVGSYNAATSVQGWDSGVIPGATPRITVPPLAPDRAYYVFIRSHNADGWGDWSAKGHWFHVAGEWVKHWVNGPDGGSWDCQPYLATPEAGQQRDHSVAFNPHRQEYLLAYMDIATDGSARVATRILDRNGRIVEGVPKLNYLCGTEGAGATDCTYASTAREFLVTSRDYAADLYGLRIGAVTNTSIGDCIAINNTTNVYEHAVAHGAAGDTYLEVWREDGGQACRAIYGRLLRSDDGTALTGFIDVSVGVTHCVGNPKVVYNARHNEFLVVYQYVVNEVQQDVYAQRVRASDGQLVGSRLRLLSSAESETNSDLACDEDLDRYLLLHLKNSSTWALFVGADGQPIGSPFEISAGGDPVRGGGGSVAWNSTRKEYLVAWNSQTSHDLYARRVSQEGSFVGEPFRINGPVDNQIGNLTATATANPVDDDYLISWLQPYLDIYTRHYRAHPLPPPDLQAPGPATDLVLYRLPRAIKISWTTPATEDFMGAVLRYKATAYPSGPKDGTFLADLGNAPSTIDAFKHTGLLPHTTYYYAVFAHDRAGNYAAACRGHAKLQPADFDGDDDVDQGDFGHLQSCLGEHGTAAMESCQDADLDEDGDVDGADLVGFVHCMGGPVRTPGC